jgi:hypothetical protein
MSDFIDVPGVSGVHYRFQRAPDPNALPVIAGNFVFVRGEGPALTVVGVGTGETLTSARKRWAEAVSDYGAEALFVRRNVSRRSRQLEHRDIVEQVHPALEAAEDFGE